MSSLANYPAAPANADPGIIVPTPAFKAQVVKVTGAILFFLVSYIVLLVLGMCLAALLSYFGIAVIMGYPQFFTLIAGAGLIGTGIMVLFFLVKFIFKRNKIDLSGLVEITAEEQPELFAFIKQISIETQSPLPKRVYLSDDVNASVFYDSSFLSLFLPVKKNLRIGLGLVNVINVSEFKAILAHEFGHFSQQSMKFGSYVYYVNNIIYNMLFDNEDYSSFLSKWTRIHSFLGIFALLTLKIVKGIQYLLRQIYSVVNKAYSRLSIQMEFHADSVSAFVTGSNHLVTSLKKLEIAQICYTNVLSYCDAALASNLRSDNFYPQQNVIIQRFAEKFGIPFKNGSLQIMNDTVVSLNKSRIVITDQWTSHPSIADREAKLKPLNIETPTVDISAWSLFNNAEQLQTDMTGSKYESVTFKQKPETLTLQNFTERFYNSISDNNFNDEYKGYYDAREIKRFSETDVVKLNNSIITFDDLFTDENCALPDKINTLKQDIQLLDTISDKKSGIKTFDFDGAKYSYRDAFAIKLQLEAELKTAENTLDDLDKTAYAYFYQKAAAKGLQNELANLYAGLFKCEDETKLDMVAYNDIMATMQPVYGHMKFPEIRLTMQDVELKEKKLIPRIKYILTEGSGFVLTDKQRKAIETYLKHTHIYFMKPNYDEQALGIFNTAMRTFAEIVMDRAFKVKKNILNAQLNYDIGQKEDCY